MNREAALLGTPTYTMFAGRLAAVGRRAHLTRAHARSSRPRLDAGLCEEGAAGCRCCLVAVGRHPRNGHPGRRDDGDGPLTVADAPVETVLRRVLRVGSCTRVAQYAAIPSGARRPRLAEVIEPRRAGKLCCARVVARRTGIVSLPFQDRPSKLQCGGVPRIPLACRVESCERGRRQGSCARAPCGIDLTLRLPRRQEAAEREQQAGRPDCHCEYRRRTPSRAPRRRHPPRASPARRDRERPRPVDGGLADEGRERAEGTGGRKSIVAARGRNTGARDGEQEQRQPHQSELAEELQHDAVRLQDVQLFQPPVSNPGTRERPLSLPDEGSADPFVPRTRHASRRPLRARLASRVEPPAARFGSLSSRRDSLPPNGSAERNSTTDPTPRPTMPTTAIATTMRRRIRREETTSSAQTASATVATRTQAAYDCRASRISAGSLSTSALSTARRGRRSRATATNAGSTRSTRETLRAQSRTTAIAMHARPSPARDCVRSTMPRVSPRAAPHIARILGLDRAMPLTARHAPMAHRFAWALW